MALQNRTIVDQRRAAVELVKEQVSVTEVARRFGVSRQAVYDWVARVAESGESGLEDRSRRPHHSPTRTPEAIEQRLLAERKKWRFGAKKILRRLQDEDPGTAWPPRSTVDAIFRRAGLVESHRRPQRRFAPIAAPRPLLASQPGEVMTADYKGQLRLRNGRLCYPLTIADPVSRYLYACQAFSGTGFEHTWEALTRVFREFGMPKILHTDNGIPFGTSGHGRFSSLSVKLMKHGIQPVYNRPGNPQDNGRHERMHKTLLERLPFEAARDFAEQQIAFDGFRYEFNHERPHEALDQDRPAKRHRNPAASFPEVEPTPVYEAHFETERVDARGRIRWCGKQIFFSEAFANQTIAFEATDYTKWRVHFATFVIGTFDSTKALFR